MFEAYLIVLVCTAPGLFLTCCLGVGLLREWARKVLDQPRELNELTDQHPIRPETRR